MYDVSYYNFVKVAKNYYEFGKGRDKDRKWWISHWREKLVWRMYCDVDAIDLEIPWNKYCEQHQIIHTWDGYWFYCISNRFVYNELMKIYRIVHPYVLED